MSLDRPFVPSAQKDILLENIRSENDQLTGDMQRVRAEIERLQSAHDGSVHEARSLQAQLDDRCLNAPTSPTIVGVRRNALAIGFCPLVIAHSYTGEEKEGKKQTTSSDLSRLRWTSI